jgi:hypothetical protein
MEIETMTFREASGLLTVLRVPRSLVFRSLRLGEVFLISHLALLSRAQIMPPNARTRVPRGKGI